MEFRRGSSTKSSRSIPATEDRRGAKRSAAPRSHAPSFLSPEQQRLYTTRMEVERRRDHERRIAIMVALSVVGFLAAYGAAVALMI